MKSLMFATASPQGVGVCVCGGGRTHMKITRINLLEILN